MWADAVLRAEFTHLTRVIAWGALSVLTGSTAWLLLRALRARSMLVAGFAAQTMLWGAVQVVVALFVRRHLAAGGLSEALRLDRMVWFGCGLDIGAFAVGAALALCGWRFGPRFGLLGAAAAIMVQASALLAMQLLFALHLSQLL